MIVYQIKNTITGDLYVGITKRPLDIRRKEHLRHAGLKKGYRIGHAIRQYGVLAFEFSKIDECGSYVDLVEAERKWIEKFKPKYNCTKGGDGILGLFMTDESRQKMREAQLRNPNRYWLGKKRSQETIDKIKETKRKRGYPYPTKQSLIAGLDNLKRAHIKQKKSVICLNDDLIFSSGIEAADFYGMKQSSVSIVCRGEKPFMKGLIFSFSANVRD